MYINGMRIPFDPIIMRKIFKNSLKLALPVAIPAMCLNIGFGIAAFIVIVVQTFITYFTFGWDE